MEFLRAFAPLSVWLIRLSLITLLFLANWQILITFELGSPTFYLALLELIAAVLLFFGGALNRSNWTAFAGLLLTILLTFQLFDVYVAFDRNFVANILILAAAMYFMANGNKT